jgi:hypothetical protein
MDRVRLELRRGQIGAGQPAFTVDLRRGRERPPAWTGMSVRPASSRMRRAFAVVSSMGTLPPTVVSPSTCNASGAAAAINSATASSWPGSVSMRMGRAGMIGRRLRLGPSDRT